ncbi:exonuclease sbcCD subunit D [Anaerostipes sp. 494a]|uniref:exonuclease SbcCD subunit D n=1 Tax=Anaerostipes sp. 494a TaxID=1261636 RepID=UPI00095228F0|nr:exonuclease SbcCD subunit D [Anaerostipes sp. 494a]OLR58913.1 exonuclease sbcCD subunit D [Anaerostipes sp. 494a]
MKLVHVADLHLGKTVNEINLLKDQEYILQQILKITVEEEADGILIAGDIYDRSIPPAEAVVIFDRFLTELSEKGIFVCCIGGNHDSGERLDFGKHFFENRDVYIEGMFSGKIKVIEKRDAYGSIYIHLLPFFKPIQVKAYYQDKKIDSPETAMRVLLEEHSVKKDTRNILVTHQFVTGANTMETSESEQEILVGGMGQISYELFSGFDYVALGHLHGPQKAGREEIRYSGSPLKYSFSEEFQKKSVVIVNIKEKGNMEIHSRSLSFLHDMRTIKGPIKKLLDPEVSGQENVEDYLRVCLTDREELVDPAAKLRMVYPNLMELTMEKNQVSEEKDYIIGRKEKTPMEMAESFLKLTFGEAEEERMKCLQALLEEGRQEL